MITRTQKRWGKRRVKKTHHPFTTNYDPGQPRDDRGRWGGGSEGGLRTGYARATAAARTAVTRYRKLYNQVTSVQGLKQIRIASEWSKDMAKKLYLRAEARYGRPTAIAIMASAQVIGWGAMGVGAMTGIPLYLPGVSVWGSIPAMAIAETFLQARRGISKLRHHEPSVNDLALTDEEIQVEVEKLIDELKEQYLNYLQSLADHTLNARDVSGGEGQDDTDGPSSNCHSLWERCVANNPSFDQHLYGLYGSASLPPQLLEIEQCLNYRPDSDQRSGPWTRQQEPEDLFLTILSRVLNYNPGQPREHGRWVGTGASTGAGTLTKVASPKILREARSKAIVKAASVQPPPLQKLVQINARIDRLGSADYEMQIRGNTVDRARSRQRLLQEFGDGHTCPCVYCGLQLDDRTITRDKILTAREGGRYQHQNLVPACLHCNQSRGDKPFQQVINDFIRNRSMTTALTYRDNDRSIPPRRISGRLTRRYVAVFNNYQAFIDGVMVDPATVVDELPNTNYNPDQPRVPAGSPEGGEFGGGGSTGPKIPDPKSVKVVKTLPGSTNPKLVKDPNGKRWVMKSGLGKEDQLHNEQDADNVYRALGVPVPHSGIAQGIGGRTIKINEYLENGQTLDDWSHGRSKTDIDNMYKEIGKHFVADALLANWDVVGLTGDNIMVVGDKPYRVDNGGALKYRAQGMPKGGKFGPIVGELHSMRDPSMNASAASVFKRVTDEDVKQQAKDLLGKRKEILTAVKDKETREILGKRLDDLQSKYGGGSTAKIVTTPAMPKPVSAGPSTITQLTTGQAVQEHIGQHATGKFSPMFMNKVKLLNPNGIENNTLVVPIGYSSKKGSAADKLETLKKILPAGIKLKVVQVSAAKLGLKELPKQPVAKPAPTITKPPGVSPPTVTKTPATLPAKKAVAVKKALTSASDGPGVKDGSIEPIPAIHLGLSPALDPSKAKAWEKSLSIEEQAGINAWKDGLYKGIRKEFNKGQLSALSQKFMSALQKAPVYEGTIYRGIPMKKEAGDYGYQQLQKIAKAGVGGIWHEAAPHSCSRSPMVATNQFSNPKGIVFRIKSKTARDIESMGMPYEFEKIGMPGTKYRITGITKNAKLNFLSKQQYPIGMLVDLEEITEP